MAPPPAKRQKRLLPLRSDDDAVATAMQGHDNSSSHVSEDNSAAIEYSSIAKRPFPTIRRKRTALKAIEDPQTSPRPPSRNFTQQSTSAAHRQPSRPSKPISTFFGAAGQEHHPNVRPKRKLGIRESTSEKAWKDEVEDTIEDDSACETLAEPKKGLQSATRSILDRGNTSLVTNTNGIVPPSQEKPPRASQRFKVAEGWVSNDTKTRESSQLGIVDLRPWAERFAPTNVEELAVHKKKVADIRNWLDSAFLDKNRKRFLILKGPSGAGKTATIRTLAKAMDLELSEWRNPTGSHFLSEGYHSMSSQFQEFLSRSGKFNGLQIDIRPVEQKSPPAAPFDYQAEHYRRKIILVEEFPSTFFSTSVALRSFRSNILEYLVANAPSIGAPCSGKEPTPAIFTPMVMIITETRLMTSIASSDSFTAHRLLGSEILSHPAVSVIEFNPIATTFLTKALNLVVQKEVAFSGRRRIPGPSVLKKLSEVGDVRSAVGSLEFLCVRRKDGDDWSGRVAAKIKRRSHATTALTKMEKETLEMITQRESGLGLFHAVGKVVYNKRDEFIDSEMNTIDIIQPPDHLKEHVRFKKHQFSVDHLIDETGTDSATFTAALHENYVMSCEGARFIDTVNGCLDALSDSDLLGSRRGGRLGSRGENGGVTYQGAASETLRLEEISFQVAVRGLLFALPEPVKRASHPLGVHGRRGGKGDAHKMFYPISMRVSRQMEDIGCLVDAWHARFRSVSAINCPVIKIGDRKSSSLDPENSRVAVEGMSPHSTPYEDPALSRTSLSCSKSELILERLPYLANIERRYTSPDQSRELESITHFYGIDISADEMSEEENAKEEFLTSNRTTKSTAKGHVTSLGTRAGMQYNVLPVEEDVGRLFLSDDDIEDD